MLDEQDEKNYKELCLFYVLVYVRFWFLAPLTTDTAKNDLELYKLIIQYKMINSTISQAAMKKFKNHLWYLSPELAVFSFFSDKVYQINNNLERKFLTNFLLKVTLREKRKMQSALLEHGEGDWIVRCRKLPPSTDLSKVFLWDLIDSTSLPVLRHLGIDVNLIMNEDPSVWDESPSYKQAVKAIKSLKVVNDLAERAINLITQCNSYKHTKNEAELQKIIQCIEDHRKRVPFASKELFSQYNSR